MIVKKCDICGAEMRMTTPRYKVTYDGWLYKEEVDVCLDCFDRITAEIKKADTPQTDYNANQCVQRIEYVGDIEKKRCQTCNHFTNEFHTPIASDGTYYTYVICTAKECHYEAVDTPQTDIHGLTDCDFCKGKNCEDCEGGKDEPQTESCE